MTKDAHLEAVDAVFGMRKICQNAVYDIEGIAKCLGRIGMRELAQELCDIAFAIDEATEKARDAYAGSISQRVADTEQSTRNMVQAFVVGLGHRADADT